jgi:hypothetical protein
MSGAPYPRLAASPLHDRTPPPTPPIATLNKRSLLGAIFVNKGAHVPQDFMLMGVRWYVAYPLSDRHVEELAARALSPA